MEKEENPNKPHALILPYPAQGHINPMLQFSKRLISKGVKVTLVLTNFILKSMHHHQNPTTTTFPFDVEAISDGFDDGGFEEAGNDDETYLSSLKAAGSQTLSNLIRKLRDSGSPVTVVIYDGFLMWALDVAKEFGVMGVVFFTQSCAVNNIYYCVQKGLLSLPLTDEDVDVELPGLPKLHVWEAPSFLRDDGSSYPGFYGTVVNQFVNIEDADWVLFNIFHKLEEEVVDLMSKRWPRLGTIGPTIPSIYLDKRLEDDNDYCINLFKPNTTTCLDWLHQQPSGSVVYVSFGSMAELVEEQMQELAWGLKASNSHFLWVVRASEEAKLPQNFMAEMGSLPNTCLVVTWCPQLEVLAHRSIGCFVTHCGFNSVVEALSLGVPIVGIPQWTDQPTNAKYVEDVWKVGVRARADERGIVRREVVEFCIKEVMEGEKGRVIKENARNWRNLAIEAIDDGGTSDHNINEFVAYITSS